MEDYFSSHLLNMPDNNTACSFGVNRSVNLTQQVNSSRNGLPTVFNLSMAIILIIIIIMSLVGNALVCCAICVNEYFRSSATYYFIFSLAVSDLLTASLSMTFDADLMFNGNRWKHGEVLCNIYTTTYSIAVPTSILNLLAVSVDRYKSLSDPLNRYRETRFMTRRRALTVIACLWVYCVTFSLIPVMGWKIHPQSVNSGLCVFNMTGEYSVISSFLNFLLPLLIMCFIYCRIYVIAQNIHNLKASYASPASQAKPAHNTTGKHVNRKFLKNVKAAKNVLLILACFFFCWMPHTILSITGVLHKDIFTKIPTEVFQSLLVMGYLNSSLNPIIYSLQNRRFRETYRRMLRVRTPRQETARVQSHLTQLSLMSSRNNSMQAPYKCNSVLRDRCASLEQQHLYESTL